jgi:hypothetical protein
VFTLAVAVACVLAGANSFREFGDQAADLLQEVFRRLGGTSHPLLRRITAPSEKRIRSLIHSLDADLLDELICGWLRATGRRWPADAAPGALECSPEQSTPWRFTRHKEDEKGSLS